MYGEAYKPRFFVESRPLCYKYPAGNNSDGIVLCKCVAYLLNNHHQDGKRQGAIERVQDVTAIRRLSTVTAGDGFLLKPFRRR
jgi:hypothetical protein